MAPFIESLSFLYWVALAPLLKNQLKIHVWVYLWTQWLFYEDFLQNMVLTLLTAEGTVAEHSVKLIFHWDDILKLACASEYPGGLVKTQTAEVHLQSFGFK